MVDKYVYAHSASTRLPILLILTYILAGLHLKTLSSELGIIIFGGIMFIVRGSSKSRSGFYKKELSAFILAAATLFISLSLVSYNAHDESWFFYSSRMTPITNWCGTVGAQCAAFLMYLFGVAAWLVVPLLGFITYLLVVQRPLREEWERFLASAGLLIVVAALCSFHGFDIYRTVMPGGGYVGYAVATLMHQLFDWIGSALFLYTSMYLCLVLLFRFSGMRAIQLGMHYVKRAHEWFVRHRIMRRSWMLIKRGAHYVCVVPIRSLGRWIGRSINGVTATPVEQTSYTHASTPVHAFMPAQAESESVTELSHTYDNQEHVDENKNNNHSEEMVALGIAGTSEQETITQPVHYGLPNLDIFIGVADKKDDAVYKHDLEQRAHILEEKLERFGVYGKVVSIKSGPVVTLFEYQPQIDTKLSKILALEDDLALALQALSIRIIAPIPGRSVVGFEVANKNRKDVLLAQAIQSDEYRDFQGVLPLILGEDTIGNNVIVDLARMPHLLIAGSTGSGKSVALNTMLISLLCKYSPKELKLILIDPKRLEFASYADIAHLLFPIVTDPKRSAPILRWVIQQMEKRYEKMALVGARNIADYNLTARKRGEEHFPFIVVVIDELSDLMLTVGREIEDLITRITQMARAAGIHMIVATQRPSVDVITGLIKVNFPSRVSFRVTSRGDSRTILDCGGADKLLGRGDMLFLDSSTSTLRRVHGAYVTSHEIDQVVAHIHAQQTVEYIDLTEELSSQEFDMSQEDEALFKQVMNYLQEIDEVSISLLQRRFRIGYNRSARIIDMLEAQGLIMPADGGKARRVIR